MNWCCFGPVIWQPKPCLPFPHPTLCRSCRARTRRTRPAWMWRCWSGRSPCRPLTWRRSGASPLVRTAILHSDKACLGMIQSRLSVTQNLLPPCAACRQLSANQPSPVCFSLPAGDSGKPGIVSLVPGGTITYENRNLFGKVGIITCHGAQAQCAATCHALPHRQPHQRHQVLPLCQCVDAHACLPDKRLTVSRMCGLTASCRSLTNAGCLVWLYRSFCRPPLWLPRSTPRTSCSPPTTCPSACSTARWDLVY